MDFDFPAKVEKLDAVPERFRGIYEAAQDGSATLLKPLADRVVIGEDLTRAIDAERRSAKELKRELSTWKALAEKPDDIKSRIAELEAAIAEKANAKTQFEKLKTDMEAAHAKALAEKDQEISRRDKAVERYLVDAAATAAIAEAKGSPKLLMPLVREHAKVTREGEDYVVRILNKDGDPRGDGKGGYLDLKGLIAELRSSPDYAGAFQGSGTSGSGAPASTGGRAGGKTITRTAFNALSPAEQAATVRGGTRVVD